MVDLLDVTANDIEDTSEVLDIDKMNENIVKGSSFLLLWAIFRHS